MTSDAGQQDSTAGKGASPSSTSPAPSPKSSSTEGKVAWEVAAPAAEQDGRTVSAPGAWLSGTTYATGVSDGVTGYDVASGTEQWSIPLSGDICQASPTRTSNGYVAVAYRTGKQTESSCTQFAVIDITKGRVVWRTALKTTLKPRGLGMSVAVTDQVAAIGWPTTAEAATAAGGSFGFELNTGKTVWTAPAPGCDGDEHVGGKVLVTHSLCGGNWKGGTHRVGHREPATGKVTWRYTTRATDAWIVSADPLIVGVNSGPFEQDAPDRLLSVSTQGKVQATWKSKDTYATGCTGQHRRCGGVLTTPGTVYLATDDFHNANSIHAFDTATGKRKWSFTPDTGLSRVLVPVQADRNGLTVHMQPTSNRGSEVIRLAAADGKSTQLMKMPDAGIGETTPDYEMVNDLVEDPLHYADQRLFVHRRGQFNYFIDAPMTMVLTTR
ncbi:PQQ-binding-like beta-propeller repeat protein [Streptomyces sp. V4I23]|uniref:outer membrane protein assembly factor BamB family protein n=1 Tax=Streptomyces sp. V4I23 TaxID=3042282 RepID=UPI0027D7C955|nr:PQQ-binding-like beta-propeller repeat protein [Streptomyces sp. V4I23]